jgi:glycosyltransferase involved in cell wall biosynthesis
LPSFVPLLPAPFLWGPVGGGESAPRNFRKSFSLRGKSYEILRDVARSIGELNPFVRMTARRAAAGLAVTPQTAHRLRALGCRNVSLSSQTALSFEELSRLHEVPPRRESPFRVISVGRSLHWKGFELGIKAFAEFHRRHPESEFWLIGDGPEHERWKQLAQTLNAGKNIVFWRTLPRSEVLEKIAACDVLLHPSLHDSGGWVTAEAMAAGRPVICLDLGGPALQVTEKTGFKIPAISPDQVVADITAALEQIVGDPFHCAQLGAAGRERIRQDFNWEKLGDQLAMVYARLVNG